MENTVFKIWQVLLDVNKLQRFFSAPQNALNFDPFFGVNSSAEFVKLHIFVKL